MEKRLGSILLTLCMLVGLLPALTLQTRAEGKAPKTMYVGDSGNLVEEVQHGVYYGYGFAYYQNSDGGMLQIADTTISGCCTPLYGYACCIYCDGDLEILVNGSVNLTPAFPEGKESQLIICVQGNLTITNYDFNGEDSTLTVQPAENSSTAQNARGIECSGTLTVKNAETSSFTLNVKAGPAASSGNSNSVGIFAKSVDIPSGTVNAAGGTASIQGGSSKGIGVRESINIGGNARVTATSAAAWDSVGIFASGYSTLRLSDEAELTATGGDLLGGSVLGNDEYPYTGGVVCSKLECADSAKLTAKGGAADRSWSFGVGAMDVVTLSGGEIEATGGDVSGSGRSYGLYFFDTSGLNMSGGRLTCTGGDCADGSVSSGLYNDSGSPVSVSGGELYAASLKAKQGDGIYILYDPKFNASVPCGSGDISVTGTGKIVAQGSRCAIRSDLASATVSVSGSILVGENTDGSDSAPIGTSRAATGFLNYRYALLDSQKSYEVKGEVQNGKLVVTAVTASNDDLLIAAAYDGGGRMVCVNTMRVKDIAETPYDTGLTVSGDCTCKLMLVDGGFVPLCEALDSSKG